MSAPRNWVVIDKATGAEVARCYDGSRDEVLAEIAQKYGDDWAYGSSTMPARFKLKPIPEPTG